MYQTSLHITFLSDWHVGSGMGHGPVADNILNRNEQRLPFLTGRCIKGALREGAWRLGLCRDDLAKMTEYLFGEDQNDKLSNTAKTPGVSSRPGRINVGMGILPADITAWLLSKNDQQRDVLISDLATLRSQTALNTETKTAARQSLRTTECGIPGIVFISSIAIDAHELADEWLTSYLRALCAGIKSIGADRARGLGRCHFAIGNKRPGNMVLPPPCPLWS